MWRKHVLKSSYKALDHTESMWVLSLYWAWLRMKVLNRLNPSWFHPWKWEGEGKGDPFPLCTCFMSLNIFPSNLTAFRILGTTLNYLDGCFCCFVCKQHVLICKNKDNSLENLLQPSVQRAVECCSQLRPKGKKFPSQQQNHNSSWLPWDWRTEL